MRRRKKYHVLCFTVLIAALVVGLSCSRDKGNGPLLLPVQQPAGAGAKPHELVVANTGLNNVLVFDPAAENDTPPLRVIGDVTGLSWPMGVAVHPVRNEIFVLNTSARTVTVYARTADGNAEPVRTLSTGSADPYRVAIDTSANELFILGNGNVMVYSVTDEGAAAPQRTLTLPSTIWYNNLSYTLHSSHGLALYIDAVHPEQSELMVLTVYSRAQMFGSNYAFSVHVYARDASGSATPLRSLIGGAGSIPVTDIPTDVAVAGGELFLTRSRVSDDCVEAYDRTFVQTAPLRTLLGGLADPWDIEIDTGNNQLIVLDGSSVKTYALNAAGDTGPTRTLSGASTGLDSTRGIVLDLANSEQFAANRYSITAYDLSAEGDVQPKRTLSGAIATGIVSPTSVAVDAVNNELYVMGSHYVGVYDRSAATDARPKRRITGGATGLSTPIGLAVDTIQGEIFVVNVESNTITVYDRTADGDTAPKRTIDCSAAGLSLVRGVSLDAAKDELYVLAASWIAVFDRQAAGNDPPKRTIAIAMGDSSYSPAFVIDLLHGEIIVGTIYAHSDDWIEHSAVLIYDMDPAAAVPLKRTLEGPATGLDTPQGVTVDLKTDEIFVANYWPETITVYDRIAEGDTAPKRTISGLAAPMGIAVTW
ncbi:MAG TPA: hypothetical protein VN604_06655 [Nitrospirota bacterium]|nr:hypothetical protein [Nitrospirota bacterium]